MVMVGFFVHLLTSKTFRVTVRLYAFIINVLDRKSWENELFTYEDNYVGQRLNLVGSFNIRVSVIQRALRNPYSRVKVT